MATPPFTGDTTDPGDTSVVSQFPANERTHRDEMTSWISTEHDTNGRHIVGAGSTAARNAITTFGVNNFWINTDTSPAVLQRCTATGTPATFENLGTLTVSISLSMPSEFSVSGSPAGNGGTLSVAKANATANQVAAGPSSGAPAPWAFRALVDADAPNTLVRTSRNVNTGAGLTGGGNLGADLTIALSSISGVAGTWGGTTNGSTAYIEGLTITNAGRISQVVTNNLPSAPAGGIGGGGQGGTSCFPLLALVLMADGTEKPLLQVRVGDWVDDGFGGRNQVWGLERPTLGGRFMFHLNGEHWTSDEHPHMRGDTGRRMDFVAPNLNAIIAEWGHSYPVIGKGGRIDHRVNVGLPDGYVKQMRQGHVLMKHNGSVELRTFEIGDATEWPPETPLGNLVLGGSGTYVVDGYVVTGWPNQNLWDYERWEPKVE